MGTSGVGSVDTQRLGRIGTLLNREVEEGRLMGAAVQVSIGGETTEPIVVGRRHLADETLPVTDDTIFLVASITKPIVSAAVVKLVEEGSLVLDDPVARYVPEFAANGKEGVEVRHLLTHTSGLPDQIPENRHYREAKRPLRDFVIRICELPLSFTPGTQISYQSSGIAMLGEICERIAGIPLAEYLDRFLLGPLGLDDTALRMPVRSERESDVKIAGEGLAHGGSGTDFDWNSDYWRGFGAPWGGMLTTVREMTQLLQVFRNRGELDGTRVLGERAAAMMVEDHSSRLPGMTDIGQKRQRWGLGWRLSGPNSDVFGDLVSDDTFGHGGATGTLAWVDPESDMTCAILTNDPEAAKGLRGRISNLAASSVIPQ